MSLFSNLKTNFTNVGANVTSRFNQIVNSSNIVKNPLSALGLSSGFITTRASNIAIDKGSVSANFSTGRGGISHASNIQQTLSDIEWSKGYNWDVRITPEPPAPFNRYNYGIPVTDVQCDFALFGVSNPYRISNGTYNVPQSKTLFDIRLTMLDDETGTMEQYFEDWQNLVYCWEDGGGAINYLSDSVRQIDITKLDSTKRNIFTRSYLVYPEQAMISVNSSQGTVRTFNINLVVAGYLGKTKNESVMLRGYETDVSATYKLDYGNSGTSPNLSLVQKAKNWLNRNKTEGTFITEEEKEFFG